jgi:SAM-dependent methyltransferase
MAKMRWFLRETTVGREPLAVSMASVRPGERVLQIGVNDPAIVHGIASKAGLTGLATVVVPTESAAERVRTFTGEGSSAADVRIEPLDHLPFGEASYDVAVIHNTEGLLASLDSGLRLHALRECLRVLRLGGRLIVLDPGTRTGMRGIFGGRPKQADSSDSAGGSSAALQSAGFTAVRVIGDRAGYRFVEGVRSR